MTDLLILIPLIAFPALRMLDGCNKIPRWAMCMGMALAYGIASQRLEALALFPALLWAYSYGWSLASAVHGENPITDWDKKFRPSGDFAMAILKTCYITNPYALGALGWLPRIFMTFWLPCAVSGNVWAVIPLALLWGWCYWLGGAIGRLVKRDIGTRIAEALTGVLLAAALVL